MKSRKQVVVLLITLVLTIGMAGGGLYFFLKTSNGKLLQEKINETIDSPVVNNSQTELGEISSRMSIGEKILISADMITEKSDGVKALAASDYVTAIAKLQESLQKNRNDPETLIYLNNAKIQDQKSVKIAVVVPIGSNLNVAQEMLRGAAQSQQDVNQRGGINGTFLKLIIANDDNKPDISKFVAEALVKDPEILAVVGHNSSTATLAGARVYQDSGLVMITPTAIAKEISGFGSYIFRTALNTRFQADTLSRYSVRTLGKKNLAICFSSDSKASVSMKEEFTSAVFADGAKVSQVECDLSKPNFNPATAISAMISDGVDGLMLNPGVDVIERAIAIAKEAKGRFLLLSDSTLYTFKVLEMGQFDVNGMILTVPWHPQAIANNSFPTNAIKLWGGNVNWRSATTFDAMQVIIKGLEQKQTRKGLQEAISAGGFSALGATGKIQFQPSGDRNNAAILVKVQQGKGSGAGYDFIPLRQN